MARKFVRNITGTKLRGKNKEPLSTNVQNDILSDDEDVYIRDQDGYHCLTDNIKKVNVKGNLSVGEVDKNTINITHRPTMLRVYNDKISSDYLTVYRPMNNLFDIQFKPDKINKQFDKINKEIEEIESKLSGKDSEDDGKDSEDDGALNDKDFMRMLRIKHIMDNLSLSVERRSKEYYELLIIGNISQPGKYSVKLVMGSSVIAQYIEITIDKYANVLKITDEEVIKELEYIYDEVQENFIPVSGMLTYLDGFIVNNPDTDTPEPQLTKVVNGTINLNKMFENK